MRPRLGRRILLLLLLLAVVRADLALMDRGGRASAAWITSGAGAGVARAAVVPQAARPAISEYREPLSGIRVFVVTWPSTRVGATAASGYLVRRVIFPGTAQARAETIATGTCAGTGYQGRTGVYLPSRPSDAQQTCTDPEGYAKGDVTYTVTPVLQRWTGPTSPQSPVYR